MIRTHTFAGRVFHIKTQAGLRKPILADCRDKLDGFEKNVVRIPVDGDTESELNCIIHEAIHACCPVLNETIVDSASKSISRFLWRLDWRKEI